MNIDWNTLKQEAIAAMKKAYVPYSKFPVGAAALTDDGRIVSG
jgi:cytidine deaminase